MRFALIATAVAIALSGCATGKKMANTESGRPEITVRGATQEAVQSELFSLCNRYAAAIRSSSSNEVVCAKPMEAGSAIMAQLVLGNTYSTPPLSVARFTIWRVGNDVRVSGYQWAETQMAMGQVRTMEINSPEAFNRLQTQLNEIERRLSASAPSVAPATPLSAAPAAPGSLSKGQYQQQQIDQLMQQNLPYEEYQKRYRQIMGE